MIIENFNPYIKKLLQNEPWRGQEDLNAKPCEGSLDWDGTVYWRCKSCERIGRMECVVHRPPPRAALLARQIEQAIDDFAKDVLTRVRAA